jgi:hypothetical protein
LDKAVHFNFSKQKLEFNSIDISKLGIQDLEVFNKEFTSITSKSKNPKTVSYRTADLMSKYPELFIKEKSVFGDSDFVVFISHYEREIRLKFYQEILTEEIEKELMIEQYLLNQEYKDKCNFRKVFLLTIPEKSIQYVKDFYIDSDLTIYIVIEKKCASDFSNVIKEVEKQVSLSLVSLYVMNYLKSQLLTIINSKDMVDIIFLNQISFDQKTQKLFSLFDTFSCNDFPRFYSTLSSFYSNHHVRSFLYKTEGKQRIF